MLLEILTRKWPKHKQVRQWKQHFACDWWISVVLKLTWILEYGPSILGLFSLFYGWINNSCKATNYILFSCNFLLALLRSLLLSHSHRDMRRLHWGPVACAGSSAPPWSFFHNLETWVFCYPPQENCLCWCVERPNPDSTYLQSMMGFVKPSRALDLIIISS